MSSVYYRTTSSHRSTDSLIACLGFGVASVVVFVVAWQVFRPLDSLQNVAVDGAVILFCAITAVPFLVAAIWLAWGWTTNRVTEVVIDRRGVRIGTRQFPWQEVEQISGRRRPFRAGTFLYLRVTGIHQMIHVPLDRGLRIEEIEALNVKLESHRGVIVD